MAMVNSQGLTEEQRYETIGRFNTAMIGNVPQEQTYINNTFQETSTNVHPQTIDTPKATATGPIVIPKGKSCKCIECKKIAYTVIRDVQDQMPSDMLRACFNPELPKDGELWGDTEGNVAIDCPLCKSEFTVWIKGEGSYSGTEDMPDDPLSDKLGGG